MTFLDWMFTHPYLGTLIILAAIIGICESTGNILRAIILGLKSIISEKE